MRAGISRSINPGACVVFICSKRIGSVLLLFLFILWRQRSVIELQRYPTSWHLRHHSLIRDIQWRSGSVRRKSLVIWRYGTWPWQRVVVYPDSVKRGEFRLLLKALYGM